MKMHETKNGKVFDEKSSLQTLIADLQKIARENKKKTAAVMYKRLEQGFEGEANEEATNEIWSSISEIDDLADLSLRVGIKITASRNKNRLFKNLYVKMQGRASEKVGFPRDIPLYINFFDRERHNRLLDWIKQNKEDNKITINWVKNSLVCLVNPEMIEEDMLIINCIIRVFCASLGKSKKEKGWYAKVS